MNIERGSPEKLGAAELVEIARHRDELVVAGAQADAHEARVGEERRRDDAVVDHDPVGCHAGERTLGA